MHVHSRETSGDQEESKTVERQARYRGVSLDVPLTCMYADWLTGPYLRVDTRKRHVL